MKEVLLTGGLGFIGRNLLAELLEQQVKVHLIIRPSTVLPAYAEHELIHPLRIDLEQTEIFDDTLKEHHFDTVFHIGAVRGGRAVSRETYKRVNVDATEALARIAIERSAKFVYCSSVGVFGAIPKELPPSETTERQEDNYYHYTKILAEERLAELKKEGLEYVVIRPSITYGRDDFGFPYSLVNMVQKGVFLNCAAPVKIHMVDIRTLSQAFINAAARSVKNGTAYNLCDLQPVALKELVGFISQELFQTDYPKSKTLPTLAFRCGELFFKHLLRNELWTARFELISRSWYYDPQPAIEELGVQPGETIPNFRKTIEWYNAYSVQGD